MTTDNASAAEIPSIIEQSRRAVLWTYSALLGVLTLYSLLQIAGGGNITAILVLLIIKTVPLLIFIPGLRSRRLRTYAWLSFVVLLYFVQSVQTAFIADARLYGVILTVLLTVLFCALVIHIRSYRNYYKTSL